MEEGKRDGWAGREEVQVYGAFRGEGVEREGVTGEGYRGDKRVGVQGSYERRGERWASWQGERFMGL